MNHLSRFKVLYLQAAVATASAIAGELGPMKDMTHEQLSGLTWVAWACLLSNVIINAGNLIVASLQHPPAPVQPLPPSSHENPAPSADSSSAI